MNHSADTELHHLLLQYFPNSGWNVMHDQGKGVNNTTRFIEADGERYVLRIYETHRDEDKVSYEHAVLLKLAEENLTFRTPVPVKSRQGNTFARTASGKIAALFRYMEGQPPMLHSFDQLRDFGRTTASLSAALAAVKLALEPVYPPYYEIEQAHPRCSLEQLSAFCASPPQEFTAAGDALTSIGRQTDRLKQQLPMMQGLPHQLIHGDLNGSNALADASGKITAVLDFEFVTCDLRVMEAAVFLSDLIRPDQAAEHTILQAAAYLEGFRSGADLTAGELDALPTLLLLRRLDVLIHFLGRYWDGIDGLPLVERQIHNMYAMTRWLEENEAALRRKLRL